MTFTFRPAKRENAPVLIGLAGGTGSGKTYSALRLARGLAGGKPFAMIDTENGRALHYADFFPEMQHGHLRAPFTPAAYADAIAAADAEGFPVIVVDSTSHIWEGEGGVLEMQIAEYARLGNREAMKMLSWSAPKQAHKRFVQRLLQVKAHVILCLRAEDKIEMVKVDGQTVVRPKVTLKGAGLDGWVPICEKRLPFEMTLSFLLTSEHPGIPKPIKLQEQHRAFFPLDKPVSEETGRELAAWAAGGAAAEPPVAPEVSAPADPTPRTDDSPPPEDAPGEGAETPSLTADQAKKLNVMVGKLRDKAGLITTEQLYAKCKREGVAGEDGLLHFGPLRDSLTKAEAHALIDSLVKFEENLQGEHGNEFERKAAEAIARKAQA